MLSLSINLFITFLVCGIKLAIPNNSIEIIANTKNLFISLAAFPLILLATYIITIDEIMIATKNALF